MKKLPRWVQELIKCILAALLAFLTWLVTFLNTGCAAQQMTKQTYTNSSNGDTVTIQFEQKAGIKEKK